MRLPGKWRAALVVKDMTRSAHALDTDGAQRPMLRHMARSAHLPYETTTQRVCAVKVIAACMGADSATRNAILKQENNASQCQERRTHLCAPLHQPIDHLRDFPIAKRA